MKGQVIRLLNWIGGHELIVLMGVLVVVGAAWGFIAIADEVREGDTMQFDEWAIRALRDPSNPANALGPLWVEDMVRDFTALGGVGVVMLITAAVVGFLLISRNYSATLLVFVSVFGGFVLSQLLKWQFERPRPQLVPHMEYASHTSFPSGHSMMSATVYLTLGALLARLVQRRRQKAYFLLVAMVLTLLVGASRVYIGVHYPTDVLAGWCAGLAWATLCWLVARRLQRRGAVAQDATEDEAEPAPKS